MISIAPITSWKTGKFHRVPILTGFNANEGSMFVPETASKSQEFTDFFRTLLPSLPKNDLVLLSEAYPDPLLGKDEKYKETRRGLGAQFMRLEQAYGHFAYVAPVLHTALFASSSSPNVFNSTSAAEEREEATPVYLYEFALPSNSSLLAYHGSHTPFITHNPEISRLSPIVGQISNFMHAYWTSFMLTGDPNAVKGKYGDRVEWPRFKADEEENMLVFGEGNTQLIGWGDKGDVVKVASDAEVRKECEFWMERTELFEL
jgi:acetylcholinesterase